MLLYKLFSERDFFRLHLGEDWRKKRILNAGSAGTRYGDHCVNVDIQPKAGVDIVGDLHRLPADIGTFDAVVCNAVLQYCENPHQVAREFYRVLRPGGLAYIDAPWIEPYCPDTPDRFRFSEDGLRSVFSAFEIVEIGATATAGSAFANLGVRIARTLTPNRYVNVALAAAATAMLYPFRWIQTARPHQTAASFYVVARKPE